MKKIKNIIVLYPSFERGGATENLINFVNDCDKKKIKIYLITNIDKKNQIKFFKVSKSRFDHQKIERYDLLF